MAAGLRTHDFVNNPVNSANNLDAVAHQQKPSDRSETAGGSGIRVVGLAVKLNYDGAG
jgi:hypothetical protein